MLIGSGNRQTSQVRIAAPAARGTGRLHSLLLALAAAGLLAAPFFPLWRITLDAPQYPEGMGMLIWAHTITGENPHDLAIINQLNHYIGMKAIVPDSIAELRFMRPMILSFGVVCLLASMRPRLWLTAALLGAFTAAGLAGMADFWYWGYEYGHDLDPMAAIKVPGASFQPPLIGSGAVLNFASSSWPALGGWLMILAGGLMAVALLWAWRSRNSPGYRPAVSARRMLLIASLPSLVAAGCGQAGPAPVHWGEDSCHHCRMTLVQKGFDAQRVNTKGKVLKFDAIECLLGELEERPLREGERLFVSDWSRPDAPPLPAGEAVYLQGGRVPSPMGGELAGFASLDSAKAFQAHFGGDLLTWGELVQP